MGSRPRRRRTCRAPRPDFHKSENEFFLIVGGTLDVTTNGAWQRSGPSTLVDLAPKTTHAFINNTDAPVVWLAGWRPKMREYNEAC